MLFLFTIIGFLYANSPQTGFYKMELQYPEGQVPFLIEFQKNKKQLTATIHNGEEKIILKDIKSKKGLVKIPLQTYQNSLELKFQKNSANGFFIRHNKNPIVKFPVTGELTKAPLFSPNQTTQNLTGKYQIELINKAQQSTPAILILKQKKDFLSATILTPYGDYRYLHGNILNNKITLANFEGVFNFLITGTIKNNKIEAIMITQENSVIKGSKNDSAVLENKTTQIQKKIDFQFPDLKQKIVSLKKPEFQNKPIILQFFGSWCPNCIDETLFLLDWYPKYKNKISLIALSFERGLTEAESIMHLKKVVAKRKINYPILLAGKTAEETPEKVLPWIKKFESFPTTIFLNKKHEVVKIHSGFTGPGTGEYFEKFKSEFNQTIQGLLK
jgi:thiol-disulfide isomerase/thioredoxin